MTENAKIQAEVALNADPAVQGFKKLEAAGAAASKSIEESGKKAERALANVGTAAEDSAKKQQSVDSRIEASLKRRIALTEAAVKGERALDEARISNRGADPQKFAGLLDELERARQKNDAYVKSLVVGNSTLNSYGQTARQTAAALRTVPAQFTDIIVSLQGGQAPLTVLLQQGGQLKDVFGGVGNAAQALGGYILGLVNPFTVLAATAGIVAFAYEKGASEQREFQKTLILTGNAAGVTAGQLSDAAARIDGFSDATQGKAAEALNIFTNAGIKGIDTLERYTATAIEFERAGGGSIEKVAENFAKLGKDPLKASLELNDSMNFLTRSLYEQIKALEDQGRSTEAAKLAQEAYNSALNDRTPQLLQNLGLIERGWKAITDATKGAYDAALNVGRAQTPDERRKDLQFKLSELSGPSPLPNAGGSLDSRKALAKELSKEYEKQLATLDAVSKFDQVIADQDKRRAESVSRARADDELRAKYLDNEIAKNKELARIKNSGLTDKEKATASASVNKKYEDKTPRASSSVSDSELTGLKARVQQEQIYLELLKTRGLEADKLNEGERVAIRIQEELKGSITGRARALKEAALDQAKLLGQTINQAATDKDFLLRQEAAAKASAKAYDDLASSIGKSTDSINSQIEKENAAAAAVGKTKEQIAALEVAKLEDLATSKDRLAALARDIDFSGQLTAKYEAEAKALRGLAAARMGRGSAESGGGLKAFLEEQRKKAIDDFQSYIDRIDSSKLDGLFNGALKGIEKLITATKTLGDLNQKSDKARAAAIEKYGEGSIQVKKIENATLENQLVLYSDIAGAAKSMYAEGSSAAKGLAVAQAGLAVASATAAIANQGLGDPYTAFARIAAMAATMSQLGIAINGLSSSSAPTSNQGTGTVFGDSTAKSASIDNSLKLLETSRLGLKYSEQMARSLKNIEAAFAGVTNLVLRNGQIGKLEAGIQTGVTNSSTGRLVVANDIGNILTGGQFSGFFNSLATKLFGNRTTIQGSGIFGGPQSFGDIQDLGFQGNYYADVQTKKKFFGITTSTTNSTALAALDEELANQFTQIFTGMGDSIVSASKVFGLRTEGVNAALESYIVDIGKIDLKGLNGEEIQEKLAAVFGAEFDKLALAIIPGLESIQQVGEGYGETLVRAATQLESVNTTFGLLGGSLSLFTKSADIFLEKLNGGFGANPGIDRAIVADQLVQQFGGLEEFNSATQAFYESFYSQGERTRATLGLLSTSLEGIGITLPDSIQSWRDLTTSLDVTTEAGQQAFEALITLGPAFADLQNQLLESAGISGSAIADVLRDGMLGRITQEDIGSKLSSIIVDGIYNSLANGFAEQISQTFTSQIIAPLLQSVATGGVLSASISQASIDAVVASATNAANQLAAILGDAGFQQAIAGVQAAISGIAGAFPGMSASAKEAAPAYQSLGSAVNSASDAASKGVDAWKSIGDSLTNEIDRIRGELAGGDKASALASFASLTAQTRAGDLEAGKLLPSASQAYIKAVEESAASLLEVKRAQGFALSSLTETRAIIGQGPAVSSPTSFSPNFNPSYSPSGAVQQNSDAVIAELKLLRARIDQVAVSTQATAEVLDKAAKAGDGSGAFGVEVQS